MPLQLSWPGLLWERINTTDTSWDIRQVSGPKNLNSHSSTVLENTSFCGHVTYKVTLYKELIGHVVILSLLLIKTELKWTALQ